MTGYVVVLSTTSTLKDSKRLRDQRNLVSLPANGYEDL